MPVTNRKKTTSSRGVKRRIVPALLALLMLYCGVLASAKIDSAAARIRLDASDAQAAWGPDMLAKAAQALPRAEQRLGLTLDRPVRVVSFRTEFEFTRYLGSQPTHVVAVARPERCEIVILRPQWFAAGADQEPVLVHEMAHLILGRRVQGRLPAWLDEGLAMVTAEEDDFEKTWRVTLAGALGGLLPIQFLMDRVTIGGGTQELAYAQSLSLTRFYLRRALPDQAATDEDNPAPLARALADPQTGPNLIRRLWDPNFCLALESQWSKSHQSVWGWIMFLSGASFLWVFISFLFLLAYWRKRLLNRQTRRMLESEESRAAEFDEEIPPWEYEGDMEEDKR